MVLSRGRLICVGESAFVRLFANILKFQLTVVSRCSNAFCGANYTRVGDFSDFFRLRGELG